jgi:hypothetical protein
MLPTLMQKPRLPSHFAHAIDEQLIPPAKRKTAPQTEIHGAAFVFNYRMLGVTGTPSDPAAYTPPADASANRCDTVTTS